jgi:hypothetical protein
VKWLFFSILLANIALYLWATGHPQQDAGTGLAAQAEVNLRTMALLEERDAGAASSGVANCMRIGPFLTQATFADATRRLAEMGLEYDDSSVSARQLKTWRVYVDVPGSETELARLRETLDAMNQDHYRFEDKGISYLSVGRLFTQPEDARRFVAQLSESGVEGTYRPELRTLGPLRWIEIDTLPDRHAREQLQAVEWGDAMASVTLFPCSG